MTLGAILNDQIVLELGLENGRNANAVLAAQSLVAWVDVLREAAKAINPLDQITVELIGTERGSLRFPQILRFAERTAQDIAEGAGEYPYLKKAAVALSLAVVGGASGAFIQAGIEPDAQVVTLSPKDRDLLAGMQKQVQSSPTVESASRRFFKTVERDPAIADVKVAESVEGPPLLVIPRAEFPERSGLWMPEEEAAEERITRDVWTVVLMRAPFVHEPRTWTFSRDGLAFSARMEDPRFLAAIAQGTVPITLQEGVMMKLEVEFRERLDGQVWQYVDRTRKAVRVLEPLPLATSSTLSLTRPPKER